MGGGLLGISKKVIFLFKTWQKMVTKFGQVKKLKCRGGSQLWKLSQLFFFNIFGHVLKMKLIFNQNIDVSVYFQNNKKGISLNSDIHPGDSWQYIFFLLKIILPKMHLVSHQVQSNGSKWLQIISNGSKWLWLKQMAMPMVQHCPK